MMSSGGFYTKHNMKIVTVRLHFFLFATPQ